MKFNSTIVNIIITTATLDEGQSITKDITRQ